MKLTVIGAGNMGGALIKGWAKSGKIDNITVADKNEALLAQFKQEYPALTITTDNVEAVKGADIVVLVVKPWLMKMVLAEVKHALDLDKQIIVSDAANFTTGMLAEELGAEGQFFYVIPTVKRFCNNLFHILFYCNAIQRFFKSKKKFGKSDSNHIMKRILCYNPLL